MTSYLHTSSFVSLQANPALTGNGCNEPTPTAPPNQKEATTTIMGNRNSSMLQDEEIRLISEETGFSPAQIERLYSRFKSLDKSGICGSLSREDFLRVPELAINPLSDRIVHMFFVDCDEDHDRINFRQFMKVLAAFRSSAKPTRSRQASRQESIQNILSSLSQNKFRHSRHSSCDGFLNYYPVQHHTTNQHSIHYVASTTHLAQYPLSSYNNIANNLNNANQVNGGSGNYQGLCGNGGGIANGGNALGGQFKKPYSMSSSYHSTTTPTLLDPDEPANSRKQKLYFMFKVYDVDNDNRLSLGDLEQILKMMVGNYISDSKLTDLAVKTLKQSDRNSDGYIDFDEFCTAFLHRDIDELLRVKFSTSCSDINKNAGSNNSKANPNASADQNVVGWLNKDSLQNALAKINNNNNNISNKGGGSGSNNGPTAGNTLTNQATATTLSIGRAVRENIFNKSRALKL